LRRPEAMLDVSKTIIEKSPEVSAGKVEIKPEYERTLERVLMVFPRLRDRKELDSAQMGITYYDIFQALPSYTSVDVIVGEDDEDTARRVFDMAKVHNPLVWRVLRTHGDKSDLWAQDYGEPVTLNGKDLFLMQKRH